MKELQLQLQKDKPGLATSLEQKFRAFEYLTCWPHHAPTETKYFSLPAQPGLKGQPGLEGGMYEMEPYVINYCRVVDTLHILYEVLKAIFPSECTVNPHLPTPLQCQQNKYVNCGRGASCKHNSSSQGCKFRHADSLEQQHDARLAQDYDGERSRFFDMYHRMALHCCKLALAAMAVVVIAITQTAHVQQSIWQVQAIVADPLVLTVHLTVLAAAVIALMSMMVISGLLVVAVAAVVVLLLKLLILVVIGL
jgi:hypothetical protein